MPRTSLVRTVTLTTLILGGLAAPVRGATNYTWVPTAAGTYLWGTNSSWQPLLPALTDYPAFDSAAFDTVDFQVDLAGDVTVGVAKALGATSASKDVIAWISQLKLGDTTGTNGFTFTKGGANSSRLQFTNDAGPARLEKRGDGTDTINVGAVRAYVDLEIHFAGGSGALVLVARIDEQPSNPNRLLTVTGPGLLRLTAGDHSRAGGTVIREATVEISGDRRLGAVPTSLDDDNVVLGNGGGLRATGAVTLDFNRGLLLRGGRSATLSTVNASDVLTLNGPLAGDPASPTPLVLAGPGTVAFVAAATSTEEVTLAGGKLQIVANGSGSLSTTAPLRLAAGTTLAFHLPSGNPAAAPLTVGALTPTNLVTVDVTGSGLTVGRFVLLKYASLGGGGSSAFRLGRLPPGVFGTLVQDPVNNSIDLDITLVVNALNWVGNVNNVWDLNTTANWTGNTGAAAYKEYGTTNVVGDAVTFGDLLDPGKLNTNVNLTATVRPATVTIDNVGYPYALTGSGRISGATTLTKVSPGGLRMALANDYSGGTFLSNGVVQVGNDAAFGLGPVYLAGATLSSDGPAPRTLTNRVIVTTPSTVGDGSSGGGLDWTGPIDFAGDARVITNLVPLTLVGPSGNGRLSKAGPALMRVTGSGSWFGSGATEVYEGTLVIDGATVTNQGAFRMNATDRSVSQVVLTNGARFTITTANNNYKIGQSGGSQLGTNVLNVSGAIVATLPTTSVNLGESGAHAEVNLWPAGQIEAASISAAGTATGYRLLNLRGGTLKATVDSGGFIQNLSNAFVFADGVTIDSGTNTLTVPQPLETPPAPSLSGGLVKQGTGTLRLNGTNTYTGSTVVSNGTLGGLGILSGPVVVTAGGTLAPGAGLGTLIINHTLALQGTARFEISRDSGAPAADRVSGITALALGGTLVVTNIGTNALALNDTFDLWDAATTTGNLSALVLPPLEAGLAWNTNQLAVSGVLSIGAGAAQPPRFTAVERSGNTLVARGIGGIPNSPYVVLSSPSVSALSPWTPVATNLFGPEGEFAYTNALSDPAAFQVLKLP